MTPKDFIEQLAPAAHASSLTTKIPVSFILADAALESGWGTSQLTVLAMNLFGVKADSSWHGDTLAMNTREFIDGQWVMQTALWRKYDNWTDALNDHGAFLHTNPRYEKCFEHTDGPGFAQAVADAGYATDPNYAQKLKAIISGNGLITYDNTAIAPQVPAPAPAPAVDLTLNPSLDPGQPALTNEQYAAVIAARHPTPPKGADTGPKLKK